MVLETIMTPQNTPVLFDARGTKLAYQGAMLGDLAVLERIAMRDYTNDEFSKSAEKYKTIPDVLDLLYPPSAQYGSMGPDSRDLIKAAGPVQSTTTGVLNEIFGMEVYSQFNLEYNAWAIMDKKPFQAGYRAKTARATSVASGGVGEYAAIPSPLMPTYEQITITKKTVAHAVNWSALLQASYPYYDSIRVPDQFKQDMVQEHFKCINEQLLTLVTTLPGDSAESLCRVMSSNDEVSNCADVDAGDADIFGIDRDAGAGWSDAQVLHNNDVNRAWANSLLDDAIDATKAAHYAQWRADDYYFLTGYDTSRKITNELAPQIRYMDVPKLSPSLNGVINPQAGYKANRSVVEYDGIPIYTSNDVPKDGASQVLLIHRHHVWIGNLLPTVVLDYGMLTRGDPSGLNALGDETLIATMFELICNNFSVNAKIRDIAA